MITNGKKSLLDRLTGKRQDGYFNISKIALPGSGPLMHQQRDTDAASDASKQLVGAELEQAYRELLLENQMLVESNARLHERLAHRAFRPAESPVTQELVRAQRDALTERSHRLREIEYEIKCLKRKYEQVVRENRRLSAETIKRTQEAKQLLRREELSRIELEKARDKLRKKDARLLALTDTCCQLQARLKQHTASSTVDVGSRRAG